MLPITKALVTGGSGFLGSALVKKLLSEKIEVRVLDSHFRGSRERLGSALSQIELIEADIRDAAAVSRATEGVDAVFHLAYINGTEHFYKIPDLILDVGIRGMINVLDACRHQQVKKLVVASSSEVYQKAQVIPTPEEVSLVVPDPMNPRFSYGGGKILSELMSLHQPKEILSDVLIFRPHNVYGPAMGFEHVVPQLARRLFELPANENRFQLHGSSSDTRSFIFIDDFTEALWISIQRAKMREIVHLGTMEEIRIGELAAAMARIAGRKVEIVSSESLKGATPRRCPDTSKIQSWGFVPKVSLEEGLRQTMNWYFEEFKKG